VNDVGQKHTGQYCYACGEELTSWDLRCSKALAYRKPVCERCIAKEYGETAQNLRAKLEDFFGMRPCQGL